MTPQKTSNPLDNIYYISLPEETTNKVGDFELDPNIKLPIETNDINSWNPESLTWEMIMSGMLKILAYDTNHKDLTYYRNFIFSVRPNIVNELTDSGIIKSKDKDFNLAEEIFLAILGLKPDDHRNILNLAVLYEEKASSLDTSTYKELIEDALKKSEEYYTYLLNQDSVLTDTYFNAGYFYIKIRDYEKAEQCLKSFIEFSDDEIKINNAKELLSSYKGILENEDIFNTAYEAILSENEHKCISIMSDFVAENPDTWNAWFLMGWAYRSISNFSEALSSLEKALECNKNNADIYNELAICHMELGDYGKSQESLEKALSITPEDVKIISNMGIVEIKRGNKEKAKNFFETVLLLSPDDQIAKQYIETL